MQASSHPISPTEHSSLMVISPATSNCDMEFHRAVFWALLFSVYCSGLSEVFSKHEIRYHIYADDTQLYVDFPRNDAASAADRLSRCVIDVKVWLASQRRYCSQHRTTMFHSHLLFPLTSTDVTLALQPTYVTLAYR